MGAMLLFVLFIGATQIEWSAPVVEASGSDASKSAAISETAHRRAELIESSSGYLYANLSKAPVEHNIEVSDPASEVDSTQRLCEESAQ